MTTQAESKHVIKGRGVAPTKTRIFDLQAAFVSAKHGSQSFALVEHATIGDVAFDEYLQNL